MPTFTQMRSAAPLPVEAEQFVARTGRDGKFPHHGEFQEEASVARTHARTRVCGGDTGRDLGGVDAARLR